MTTKTYKISDRSFAVWRLVCNIDEAVENGRSSGFEERARAAGSADEPLCATFWAILEETKRGWNEWPFTEDQEQDLMDIVLDLYERLS